MRVPVKRYLPALICPVTLLVCELISRPWAEMGISDDWSYVRTAQILAQTGHLAYNGWATALVGWQLYLAAACIKLFGFSFSATRLPTLIIALLTAYLMQRTLVRIGIGEGNAVLGTLTFVLSPLFMMLSVTMMTDVPGFFSILACIYCCIRALQSIRDRDTILWLSFAVAVNTICGTSRQIAWLGVLVVVPSTLWLLRSRRAVLLYGVVVTALGFVFVFAALHWFNAQPYALPEPISLSFVNRWAMKRIGIRHMRSLVEIGWMLLPLTIPFIAAVRRFSVRSFAGLAVLGTLWAALAYLLGGKEVLASLFDPFNLDWVGPHAMLENTFMKSAAPTVLGPDLVVILAVIGIVGVLCIGATVLFAWPAAVISVQIEVLSWYRIAILFVPLTCVYFFLLAPRSVNSLLDRYLLTPIFLALVCLLLYAQQHLKFRRPVASYVALAAIAFYGVISTHNLFAFHRAHIALAKEILDAGVPLNHVDLGFEMNGWNEVLTTGYLNDPRIIRPAGAYQRIPHTRGSDCEEVEFGLYPHLASAYGLAFEPNFCEGLAPFTPVSYSTWPLLHPTVLYVVRYPTPKGPESDYIVPENPEGTR